MLKPNKHMIFTIILFLLIVLASAVVSLWLTDARARLWTSYVIGFVFSTIVGGKLIQPLSQNMHERVKGYIRAEYPQISFRRIRPLDWFPAVFGYIERPMYTASVLFGKPEFIAVWLGVKMLARWSLPRTEEDKITDSRHRYYPVLVGNLLGVAYGVAGALVIKWLKYPCRFWFALATMAILVLGTLSLTLYESYKYKNWLQNKEI